MRQKLCTIILTILFPYVFSIKLKPYQYRVYLHLMIDKPVDLENSNNLDRSVFKIIYNGDGI